jgi:hypothetical protein
MKCKPITFGKTQMFEQNHLDLGDTDRTHSADAPKQAVRLKRRMPYLDTFLYVQCR